MPNQNNEHVNKNINIILTEAVKRRCSMRKVLLKISQNV